MAQPSIDVVIVNWNAGIQLRQCIQSLASNEHEVARLQLTVVDNASTDGSLETFERCAPTPVRIVRNQTNRGFAAACNRGARDGTGEFVLFLNPDTVVAPTALAQACAAFSNPGSESVGIIGVQLFDDAGNVARSCARFPTPAGFVAKALGLDRLGLARDYMMSEWPHDETRVVDHVIGAFYLVRRRVFEQLGGFDERFFVYLEDLDFSFRARQAGWRSLYLADTRVFHRGGGTSEQIKGRRLAYALRSRLVYARKHFTPSARLAVAVTTLCAEPVIRLVRAAGTGAWGQVGETIEGYGLLWRGRG